MKQFIIFLLFITSNVLFSFHTLGQKTLTEFNQEENSNQATFSNTLKDIQGEYHRGNTTTDYQNIILKSEQFIGRCKERIEKCQYAIRSIPEKPENTKTSNIDYKSWTESLISEYNAYIKILNYLIKESTNKISFINSETEEKRQKEELIKKQGTENSVNDFWNDNNDATQLNVEKNTSEKQNVSPEEVRKIVQADIESRRVEQQNQVDQLVGKTTGLVQSYYQLQTAGDAYNKMRELSSLNGKYNSVEDLERDFRNQSSMIRQETNNFIQAKSSAANTYVDLQTSTPEEQAYGEVLKSFSNIIVQAQADKAAREAREELARQKELIRQQIEAENIRAKVQLRTKLCEAFVAGGTPLSAHKIQEPVVYMFAYIVDPTTFKNQTTSVWLSEVFPVSKYSDNTFPYKNTLINRFKNISKGEVILVGFYTNEKNALNMHQSFSRLASVSEFTIIPFKSGIKEMKATTLEGGTTDFWETGKQETVPESNNNNSSFWNE